MSRIVGLLICLFTMAATAAFIWGLVLRSYWAIAIPIAVATLGVLALMFWIGMTFLVGEWAAPPPAPTKKDEAQ